MEPDVVNLTFCPTTLGLATDESAIEMTGLGLVTSLEMEWKWILTEVSRLRSGRLSQKKKLPNNFVKQTPECS